MAFVYLAFVTIHIYSPERMHVLSVNVGLPKEVVWKGEAVITSIFKEPIEERVKVRLLNVDGDRQADLTVHGGHDKALYAYAAEHYEYWRKKLPRMKLPWGSFGENLTIEGGFFEADVCVGDRFVIGTAEVVAVQPRLPCYKLGIRFGDAAMLGKFLRSWRLGVYFRVLKEGEIGAGDTCERIATDPQNLTILELGKLFTVDQDNYTLMRRAVEIDALPEQHREHFLERLREI